MYNSRPVILNGKLELFIHMHDVYFVVCLWGLINLRFPLSTKTKIHTNFHIKESAGMTSATSEWTKFLNSVDSLWISHKHASRFHILTSQRSRRMLPISSSATQARIGRKKFSIDHSNRLTPKYVIHVESKETYSIETVRCGLGNRLVKSTVPCLTTCHTDLAKNAEGCK